MLTLGGTVEYFLGWVEIIRPCKSFGNSRASCLPLDIGIPWSFYTFVQRSDSKPGSESVGKQE